MPKKKPKKEIESLAHRVEELAKAYKELPEKTEEDRQKIAELEIEIKRIYDHLKILPPAKDSVSYAQHYDVALQAYKAGMYDKAVKELEPLVMQNPEDHKVLDSLGAAYREKGNLDKALETSEKAAALAPDNPDYHTNLGMVYFKLSRYEEAKQEAEKAIKLSRWMSKERRSAKKLLKETKYRLGLPNRLIEGIEARIGGCEGFINEITKENKKLYSKKDKLPVEAKEMVEGFVSEGKKLVGHYESHKIKLISLRDALFGKGPDEAEKLKPKLDALDEKAKSIGVLYSGLWQRIENYRMSR